MGVNEVSVCFGHSTIVLTEIELNQLLKLVNTYNRAYMHAEFDDGLYGDRATIVIAPVDSYISLLFRGSLRGLRSVNLHLDELQNLGKFLKEYINRLEHNVFGRY